MRRVGILLPMPLGPLDYAVPEGVDLAAGDFVAVELGTRPTVGVVWGSGDGAVPAEKLKMAGPRLDVPPMRDEMRRFLDRAPWLGIFPGLAITVMIFGLNALGDGLRNAVDPRRW